MKYWNHSDTVILFCVAFSMGIVATYAILKPIGKEPPSPSAEVQKADAEPTDLPDVIIIQGQFGGATNYSIFTVGCGGGGTFLTQTNSSKKTRIWVLASGFRQGKHGELYPLWSKESK